jgi:hypothetical protein
MIARVMGVTPAGGVHDDSWHLAFDDAAQVAWKSPRLEPSWLQHHHPNAAASRRTTKDLCEAYQLKWPAE